MTISFTTNTFQNGVEVNGDTSVCSYLQRVLNSSEKLDWVTYGSPPPDNSLLNDSGLFRTTSKLEGECAFLLQVCKAVCHC